MTTTEKATTAPQGTTAENMKYDAAYRLDVITGLAKTILGIKTLETQNDDSLDFHEVSAWSLKAALKAAYDAGRYAAEQEAARK